jgi:hypothetical protein
LGINHYTTFFTLQSQKESILFMDTGVTDIVDDKYATASSVWLQVSRKGTAEVILHIGLYIYLCVFVCVYVFIGIVYI